METLFVLLIAGCAETASPCSPLVEREVAVPDIAACERLLDDAMARQTAPWPEYRGICLPALPSAKRPDWAPSRPVVAQLPQS